MTRQPFGSGSLVPRIFPVLFLVMLNRPFPDMRFTMTAALGLGVTLALAAASPVLSPRRRIAWLVLSLVSGLLVWRSYGTPWGLLVVAGCRATFAVVRGEREPAHDWAMAASAITVAYAIQYWPIERFLQAISVGVSSHLTGLTGAVPTPLGWPVSGVVPALVAALAVAGVSMRRPRAKLIVLAAVLVQWVLFLVFAYSAGSPYPATLAIRRQLLLTVLLGVTVALGNVLGSAFLPRRRLRLLTALAVLTLLTTVALAPVSTAYEFADGPRRVEIVAGLGSFDMPDFGRPTTRAAGMFGGLLKVLDCLGVAYGLHADLSTVDLSSADALVVINPLTVPEPGHREETVRFIRDGGRMLVLGDHTDVGGSKTPLDYLLDPFGVSFNFDSALPVLTTWDHTYTVRDGWFTPERVGTNRGLMYGTGASLTLTGNRSRPILQGYYCFSDAGDYDNVERAYLGDYHWNRGEILGGIALAAESGLGRGRVLVFGDTSMFQNISLPYSYSFVLRVLYWLLGSPKPYLAPKIALLVVTSLSLTLAVRSGTASRFSPLMLIPLILVATWNYGYVPPLEARYPEPLAAISTVWFERVAEQPFDPESPDGLIVNLYRNGLFPVLARTSLPQEAKLVVSIAPQTQPSRRQLSDIANLMDRGTWFLFSIGHEDARSASLLLSHLNVMVRPEPLGPWPHGEARTAALKSAWRVSAESGSEQLFLGDEAIGSIRPLGSGGFIVVADSYFLLANHLESEQHHNEAAVQFLRELLAIVHPWSDGGGL